MASKQLSTKKKDVIPCWKKSEEKQILKKYILDGVVSDDMSPDEVYKMHEGFRKFNIVNFKQNLLNLRRTIARKKQQVIVGNVAFERFKNSAESSKGTNHVKQVPWNSSEAKKLLVSDIDADRHIHKTPKEIWQSRPQYQEFTLDKFRNYYYDLRNKIAKDQKQKAKAEQV